MLDRTLKVAVAMRLGWLVLAAWLYNFGIRGDVTLRKN